MDLRLGERLKNLSGDTVWVQQKLPRPGPTPVYNLEVQDEHVYYVGASGVLAHNSTSCDASKGTAHDIALGIRADKGGMLEQFSENIGAANMHRWKELGLYDDGVNGWGRAFMQAMNRTKAKGGRAHFDVTGLDISRAKAGNPASWLDSYTAFELRSILRRKDWFEMTDFYRSGVRLTPRELIDLGIIPHTF